MTRRRVTAGMNRPGLVAFGAFLIVIGAIWFGQGVGWIGGSAMTDVTLWAVIGPFVAMAGLIFIMFGFTGSSRDDAGR